MSHLLAKGILSIYKSGLETEGMLSASFFRGKKELTYKNPCPLLLAQNQNYVKDWSNNQLMKIL